MNIAKMMQQASRIQNDMKTMQERMKTMSFDASVAGVAVTMIGSGEVSKITIDANMIVPSEKEMLEDMIVAALNQARAKMEQAVSDETQKIMGGLKLPPGFQMPF